MSELVEKIDFDRLSATVEHHHLKANKTHLLAVANREQLVELSGRDGKSGIVDDIAEIKEDGRRNRKLIEKNSKMLAAINDRDEHADKRERRSGAVNSGFAAGGAGLVVALVEIFRALGWL